MGCKAADSTAMQVIYSHLPGGATVVDRNMNTLRQTAFDRLYY